MKHHFSPQFMELYRVQKRQRLRGGFSCFAVPLIMVALVVFAQTLRLGWGVFAPLLILALIFLALVWNYVQIHNDSFLRALREKPEQFSRLVLKNDHRGKTGQFLEMEFLFYVGERKAFELEFKNRSQADQFMSELKQYLRPSTKIEEAP